MFMLGRATKACINPVEGLENRSVPPDRLRVKDLDHVEGNRAVVVGTDAWNLAAAESEQLIAAVKDECIVSQLLGFTANEVSHAAMQACRRASLLRERRET